MKKGMRQLSLADRSSIEAGLRQGLSIRDIAKSIGRSPSTVAREVGKHLRESFKNTSYRPNICVHRTTCARHGVCADKPGCRGVCRICTPRKCNRHCQHVEYIDCEKRMARTCHACNGCPDEARCHIRKFYYVAEAAHEEYLGTLSKSRAGAAVEEGELARMDDLLSWRIAEGQSIHHVVATSPGLFTVNERTIFRYVNAGLMSAGRGDLKRACTLKRRKPRPGGYEHKVEKGCYVGRTHADYMAYMAANPRTQPVLMDLLIGRVGGKCLLTLHWPVTAFMAAFPIAGKCAAYVNSVFEDLYSSLGVELYRTLFGVILTDRGTEFSNPSAIEMAPDGSVRSRVFFCDPMNSNQKSQIERNHELVREVLPKGSSFDKLEKRDVALVLSCVNSYVRLAKGDRTPYDLFQYAYGKGVAEKLGIRKVAPERVCLKPMLMAYKKL